MGRKILAAVVFIVLAVVGGWAFGIIGGAIGGAVGGALWAVIAGGKKEEITEANDNVAINNTEENEGDDLNG